MLRNTLRVLILMICAFMNIEVAFAGDFIYPVGSSTKILDNSYYMSQDFDTSYEEGFWYGNVWKYGHDGIDLSMTGGADDCGKSVYAAGLGTVTSAESNRSGWGGFVRICHETTDGTRCTAYGHLQDVDVTVDQEVSKGTQIGTIGSGGASTACHLHFTVTTSDSDTLGYYSGTPPSWIIDPIEFIANAEFIDAFDGTSALDNLEDTYITYLNPFSGHNDGVTVLDKLGSRDGDFHIWSGASSISYDDDGVATDAWVQDYTGGNKDGAVIVYEDANYAVPIWGTMWDLYIDNLDSSWTVDTSDCNVDWFNGQDYNGPSYKLGLPITHVYEVSSSKWRQDFQRGYVTKNNSDDTLRINCFSAYQSTSEPGTPGWSDNGGWDGAVSAAVTKAYWRNGAKMVVGYPYDNGGDGANIHEWGSVWVQDFTGGDNEDNAIIVNGDGQGSSTANGASLVRHGFWEYYLKNDGAWNFGAPLGDEMSLNTKDGHLRGYDPYCDSDSDGRVSESERENCIYHFCGTGTSYDWESMQRFEGVTLCWDDDWYGGDVICDPTWTNPNCPGNGGSYSATSTGSSSSSDSSSDDSDDTTETTSVSIATNTIMMIYEPDAGLWHWMTSDGEAMDGSHSEEATQWYANSNGSDCYDTFYRDVDGDDLPDLIFYEDVDGAWYVQLGDGTKDGFTDDGSWLTGHGESSDCSQYQGFLGDVDGDGLVDAITYETAIGEWYVAYNTGTSFDSAVDLVLQSWGNQTYDRFNIYVEDVTGDGVVEFVAHEHALGKWHAAENDDPGVQGTTYSGLTYLLEENWCKQTYSDQYVCELTDLDGDGAAEPVAYEPVDGDHHKAISNGVTFDSSSSYLVGDWLFGTSGQYVSYYIDVTFDGHIDVVVWEPDTGYWYVADGNGDGTANSSSTVWVQPAAVQTYEDKYIPVPLK